MVDFVNEFCMSNVIRRWRGRVT